MNKSDEGKKMNNKCYNIEGTVSNNEEWPLDKMQRNADNFMTVSQLAKQQSMNKNKKCLCYR